MLVEQQDFRQTQFVGLCRVNKTHHRSSTQLVVVSNMPCVTLA